MSELSRYESFPVQTEFRRGLIERLGLIAIAEKHIPEVVEGMYEETLDALRVETELQITLDNSATLNRRWEGVFDDL